LFVDNPVVLNISFLILSQAWTGQPQSSTSVYGIRIYQNNSILAPHVDRLPLVSSAILNVAQDVDEPWFLEVYDHQGHGTSVRFVLDASRTALYYGELNPCSFSHYAAHNVSMDAGDLVLYESHSIIHGRPFRMHGKFYANIFIHFEPLGLPLDMPDDALKELDVDFPPYIIPGSSWEKEWREVNPDGWTLMKDPITLVQRGELRTLKYIGKLHPEKLHETDGTPAEWMPIHEAVRSGHVDVLKYLIDEQNADMNQWVNVGEGMFPLDLARQFLDENHPVLEYLESIGARSIHDDEL
jgi:prolyl 4-hydroxylase